MSCTCYNCVVPEISLKTPNVVYFTATIFGLFFIFTGCSCCVLLRPGVLAGQCCQLLLTHPQENRDDKNRNCHFLDKKNMSGRQSFTTKCANGTSNSKEKEKCVCSSKAFSHSFSSSSVTVAKKLYCGHSADCECLSVCPDSNPSCYLTHKQSSMSQFCNNLSDKVFQCRLQCLILR